MSQAGELNVVQNHPEIPTTFIADVGTATPIANELEILGTSIAASGVPVHTTGATNVITVEVQRASAQASSSAANAGIASFNSADFTVDSNGFVTLAGSSVVETLTGNTGGAISPSSGNINTVGTGSITIAGSGSTLTTQLTGLTNNAIQVGAGTATLTQLGPTNRSVLTTGSTGVPVLTALTDGQVIIGSTAGAPAAATLTAGTGISITNASNSITINGNGGGLNWTDVTGISQAMAVNNGYTANNAGLVTLTLPATATYGSVMAVVGKGTGGWKIAQNSGQTIHFGSRDTTTGATGSLASTAQYDCAFLLCTVANTDFTVYDTIGNITVA